MEAEIERLYQLTKELSDKVNKLEIDYVQSNVAMLELEQRFENLKRALLSGFSV